MNGLKYISLYESNGYGIAAKNYLKTFLEKQIPLTWTPMIPGRRLGLGYEPYYEKECNWPELAPVCNKYIDYDTVIIHTVPEYFPYWIKREAGKKIIGYTVWETDKLPKHWPDILNTTDYIIVPCEWNKEVFIKCGVRVPISVLPHVSEFSDMPCSGELDLLNNIPSDHYVFYTIGEWTNRKAMEKTIGCYLDTFSANDPVTLIIKTSKYDLTRRNSKLFKFRVAGALKRITKNYSSGAKIILITQELNQNEMYQLHKRGDCYVSLCHSEGWGYGAYEAAFCGNPVTITGYGGQLDYLKADLAYLVDYTVAPVIDKVGKKSYSPDQNWADADLTHASRIMNDVFSNRNLAKDKGKELRKHLIANFSKEKIAKTFLEILRCP